jgi:hypothetical protein
MTAERSPGAALAHAFYEDVVGPIVQRAAPGLRHLVGRLGSGSDVLGFDDERSTDHDFGCRLTVLVDEEEQHLLASLDRVLEAQLPESFHGWPVRFPMTWDDRVRHQVDVSTVYAFARGRLGVEVGTDLGVEDWLSLTGQSVLEVIGGSIFHDGTTEYGPLAERLAWYPQDLWFYVLASAWGGLAQELPLVGRTGERGDELGSSLIAARLARRMIHLAFLLERRWPPYPKWAGLALPALATGPLLAEHLHRAAGARGWHDREEALCAAAELLAGRQEEIGVPTARPAVEPFFSRPFRITNEQMRSGLMGAISDLEVRRLPVGIGSVEQWCDNVDLLAHPERRPAVRELYRRLLADDSPSE